MRLYCQLLFCLHSEFLSNFLINFSAVLNVHSLSNKSKIKQTFNFLDLLKLCYFISASNSPAVLVLLTFDRKTSDSPFEESEKSLKPSYLVIFFFVSKGEQPVSIALITGRRFECLVITFEDLKYLVAHKYSTEERSHNWLTTFN